MLYVLNRTTQIRPFEHNNYSVFIHILVCFDPEGYVCLDQIECHSTYN